MDDNAPAAAFAATVPGDAPLVVRCKRGTRVLYVILLCCVAFEIAAMAGLVAVSIWMGAAWFLVLLPFLALQVLLMGVVVREYRGLLGPQLAADHTGVWVRTGLGAKPETVHLPWSAIDGIDALRKGPVVRIMSARGDALYGRRPHWRVRSLRRRFGTPFIVDGRRSVMHPVQIVEWLRQMPRLPY
nr:hypothetical protein [Kibdelosporangium sp. MJ126-NF4]CEL13589.1 hypothetical protein [Kibdelosporangium sp. MJ126-NF4]CTQ99275.1 hypothetical protein [Kibdelosporangium sp. MJ126-NF4]